MIIMHPKFIEPIKRKYPIQSLTLVTNKWSFVPIQRVKIATFLLPLFYLLNTLFDDIIKIRSLDSARLSFKCITFLLNWGICVQFTNHHFFFFKWKDIHSVCIKRLIRGTTIWEIKHKLWICEMSYSFFDVFGWHVQLVKTSSVTNSVFIWWHTSMWNEFRHQ